MIPVVSKTPVSSPARAGFFIEVFMTVLSAPVASVVNG